jgi:Uma2 family endonuclease
MTVEKTLLTADDLFHLPDDGMRHELVRGELRTMPPAGGLHGSIANRLANRITNFVEPRGLGEVFAAETGFWIDHNPDVVRAPDVAFVAAGRLPEGVVPVTYVDLVPDLLAEVVSPNDTATEVEEKVHDWLRAGSRMVLVLHWRTKSVTVYRSFHDVVA